MTRRGQARPAGDHVDVRRAPGPHVGFGAGVCLGAPPARMGPAQSLRRLLRRLPGLTPPEPPRRRPTLVLRGYEAVRVTAAGKDDA
jgi:cytochrome P450